MLEAVTVPKKIIAVKLFGLNDGTTVGDIEIRMRILIGDTTGTAP
jgi:hypothetical protein